MLTSKGAGTMAWSRLKRRVLLREDPESPWMSGGVKTKVTRTSLNWSKQTSKDKDDGRDQTGSSFSCFDLAGSDDGPLRVFTQTLGPEVSVTLIRSGNGRSVTPSQHRQPAKAASRQPSAAP